MSDRAPLKDGVRAYLLELALVVATTSVALAVLWLVDTQIYTEPWTLDPWFYTALMSNFDFAYQWFSATYYASRLPLILPGLFLNSFLTPEHAYVVYHATFYFAGAGFLYLLMRSVFGPRVALFVYPAVLTNAIYVDSHTWDYFDGVLITYLSGGLYFLISTVGRSSRIRPALAGLFLAAAVATNLYALLLALGAIGAYIYGRAKLDGRAAVRGVALDALWFAVGAAVLFVSCGWFAKAHGGPFLFVKTSVVALRLIDLKSYKLPTYDWMLAEPRLLVPLFLAAIVAVAWRRLPRGNRGELGLAVAVAGFAIFLLLMYWEFGRSGTFLQIPYYFSPLYPFLLLALATAVYGLLARSASDSRLPPAALAALGLVAGAAPLVIIYGLDRPDFSGERGAAITLTLMAVTFAVAGSLRLSRRTALSPVIAVLAAALAVTSANYASAATATTYANLETRSSPLAHAGETFSIGVQLVDFMRRNDLQDTLPAFWYDQSADAALSSLQSLYYYGYTYLNFTLPVIDDTFRAHIRSLNPRHVILLCTEPTCRHGGEAMRRAGYRVSRVAAERLHSGSESVWAQAYALERPAPAQP